MHALRRVVAVLAFGGALALRSRRSNSSEYQHSREQEGNDLDGMDLDFDLDPLGLIFDKCDLAKGPCPIKDMRKLTFVYTGDKKTQCMNGSPYAFAVRPGDPDKLLFHFAGGGACWERKYPKWPAQKTATCASDPALGKVGTAMGFGAFSTKKSNVFHKHSVVAAVYCSGGAHVADSSIKTPDKTYRQTDYWNVKATRDWTLSNFGRLSSFVVVGLSAGSLGSAFWASDFFTRFQYDKASMVWDSYSGVFPPGTQSAQLQAWGICNVPILSSEAKQRCDAQELTVDWVAEQAIKNFPQVNFVSVQSKGDSIQRKFYGQIAETLLGKEMTLSAEDLEKETQVFFDRYSQYPNYDSYWVNGDQHCFLPFPFYYTTSPKGGVSAFPPGDLNGWLGDVIDHKARS